MQTLDTGCDFNDVSLSCLLHPGQLAVHLPGPNAPPRGEVFRLPHMLGCHSGCGGQAKGGCGPQTKLSPEFSIEVDSGHNDKTNQLTASAGEK